MKDHDRYANPKYRYGSSALGNKQKADPDRCRWEVSQYIGSWPHYRQCSFKHKPDSLWCKVHNPEVMAARESKTNDKHERKWQIRRKEIHSSTFYAALKEIAEGNLNDPIGYAQMILDEFHEHS